MKINFLKLFTGRLEEQLHFYQKVLQFPVRKMQGTSFRVVIGYTVLEFHQLESATPYHFAIHIPAFQEEKALEWLEERVAILKDGTDKIIDFPGWKARSVYFYDPDKNIVELISRREYFPAVSEIFSEESMVGISEIGLATENVEEKFQFLNTNFGLEKFTGDYERFCATGDDEGLFIIINKNIKDWIPTGDKAFASPFEIRFTIEQASFGAVFKHERLDRQ